MNREGSSNNNSKQVPPNASLNALSTAFGEARVGNAKEAVQHIAPNRVHTLVPKRHTARLSERAWKGKKKPFTLGKPTYVYSQLEPVPGIYVPYRKHPLLQSKHKTPKLRALDRHRRGVILGLKKQTRRPQQKSTRKSTRRKTVK